MSRFHDAVTQENPPDLIQSFRKHVNNRARGSNFEVLSNKNPENNP